MTPAGRDLQVDRGVTLSLPSDSEGRAAAAATVTAAAMIIIIQVTESGHASEDSDGLPDPDQTPQLRVGDRSLSASEPARSESFR